MPLHHLTHALHMFMHYIDKLDCKDSGIKPLSITVWKNVLKGGPAETCDRV